MRCVQGTLHGTAKSPPDLLVIRPLRRGGGSSPEAEPLQGEVSHRAALHGPQAGVVAVAAPAIGVKNPLPVSRNRLRAVTRAHRIEVDVVSKAQP